MSRLHVTIASARLQQRVRRPPLPFLIHAATTTRRSISLSSSPKSITTAISYCIRLSITPNPPWRLVPRSLHARRFIANRFRPPKPRPFRAGHKNCQRLPSTGARSCALWVTPGRRLWGLLWRPRKRHRQSAPPSVPFLFCGIALGWAQSVSALVLTAGALSRSELKLLTTAELSVCCGITCFFGSPQFLDCGPRATCLIRAVSWGLRFGSGRVKAALATKAWVGGICLVQGFYFLRVTTCCVWLTAAAVCHDPVLRETVH